LPNKLFNSSSDILPLLSLSMILNTPSTFYFDKVFFLSKEAVKNSEYYILQLLSTSHCLKIYLTCIIASSSDNIFL